MRSKWGFRISAIIAFMILGLVPSLASAQTVSQFTNSTSGSIVDSPTCTTTLTRSFSVGTSFNVSDVNIGVRLTHTYRADLRITLTSPTGTTVQLINAVGSAADNLNVLFDDEAASAISTHTADDTTGTVPPYLRTFRPSAALSAFDGQNALGTWTMTICDLAAQDTGTFTRADIYITQAPTSFADLSLTKTVSNGNPSSGSNITYTLTVSSASTSNVSATGVTVLDVLPAGVTFVSATGTGSYNNATGVWTVGTIAANSSATINIIVTVTASNGTTVTNIAEILASSASDIDSTPNNGATTEDDYALVSFIVSSARTAGTPPTLVCPAGTSIFDWDVISWPAGATSGSYPVAGIGTINFSISISNGAFLNNPPTGGQSPARQTNFTGGLSPNQVSLIQLVNFTNKEGSVTTTLTLPTAVPGVQFRLFDVDYAAAEFADRVTITGTFNGASVSPTLTNSLANYVIGNNGYGDGNAASNSADGTVFVTFSSPVDTVVINYGNFSLAPADPLSQAISIFDFTFCRPQGNVTLSKTSRVVSDGVSGANHKALPDAIVRYCILATNTGSSTVTNFAFDDTIPATLRYVTGSMTSGPNCNTVKSLEDDDAIGADETDPIGASIGPDQFGIILDGVVRGRATTLGPGSAFAISFDTAIR
ncbi:proprotein convertase P-domain-containing protein [Sphingorhabdus sp.]|uniref:proprotein convertase P-domain-containing protein n=1 Tax=Sphingorhabdus sp. TaxID=1902408 RepID=UPI003919B45B